MTIINDPIISRNYQKEHYKRDAQAGFFLLEHATALILFSFMLLAAAAGLGGILKIYASAALYHKAHVCAASSLQAWMCDANQGDRKTEQPFKVTFEETPAKLQGNSALFIGRKGCVTITWYDGIQQRKVTYQGFKTDEVIQL